MRTFIHAKREHLVVCQAAAVDEIRAAELWNAITGLGSDPRPGSFAEAVRDTVPVEHGALLSTDPVAAAFAFDRLWHAGVSLATTATGYESRDRARTAWAAFVERASRVTILSEGFGWDTSSAWAQAREVDATGADLADVERIARLAGRMVVALRGAKARRVHGVPSEVYSVEQGSDIARLLPSELVMLTEPLLELTVLDRLATRRAAQYAVRGAAAMRRGPLVLALDESGSMHGERNAWAKAAAVALARVAAEDHRTASVVHFSTSAVVQELRSGDATDVLRMVRRFLGGGTAIGLALEVALDQVQSLARRGENGADVVLVTDGIDGDIDRHASAVRALRERDVRLWTVSIECDVPSSSPLREHAAQYCRLGGVQLTDAASVIAFGAAA